jgi:ferredoxin
MNVNVRFLPDNVSTIATAGESILNVAERAGVKIPTGCLTGYCRACEIQIDGQEEPICACISGIPSSASSVTIQLYDFDW